MDRLSLNQFLRLYRDRFGEDYSWEGHGNPGEIDGWERLEVVAAIKVLSASLRLRHLHEEGTEGATREARAARRKEVDGCGAVVSLWLPHCRHLIE